MLEQESKPGARLRRTLRQTERRRVLRNRLLGGAVALSLAIGAISAAWRVLPQWMNTSGKTITTAASVKPAVPSVTTGSAVPAPASTLVNNQKPRPLSASVGKPIQNAKLAQRAGVPATALGPEILPVDQSDVPHRRKRRRRSIQQPATAQSPATTAPPKQAETAAPPAKSTEPVPAPTTSKPPDDVPDNP